MKKYFIALFLVFFLNPLYAFKHYRDIEYKTIKDWIVYDYHISHKQANEIIKNVYKQAFKHKIDPLLIFSLIEVSSSFRPHIVSKKGAIGLLQIVPTYHHNLIKNKNLLNISTNIKIGVYLLNRCLIRNKDDTYLALRCYSGKSSPIYFNKIHLNYLNLQSYIYTKYHYLNLSYGRFYYPRIYHHSLTQPKSKYTLK